MTVLLILYAGLIPAVPLAGAEIFKRRGDDARRRICWFLFFVQLALSACYVGAYLSR